MLHHSLSFCQLSVTATVNPTHVPLQVSMSDPRDPLYNVHAARRVMGFDVYHRHRYHVSRQCVGDATDRPLQVWRQPGQVFLKQDFNFDYCLTQTCVGHRERPLCDCRPRRAQSSTLYQNKDAAQPVRAVTIFPYHHSSLNVIRHQHWLESFILCCNTFTKNCTNSVF